MWINQVTEAIGLQGWSLHSLFNAKRLGVPEAVIPTFLYIGAVLFYRCVNVQVHVTRCYNLTRGILIAAEHRLVHSSLARMRNPPLMIFSVGVRSVVSYMSQQIFPLCRSHTHLMARSGSQP